MQLFDKVHPPSWLVQTIQVFCSKGASCLRPTWRTSCSQYWAGMGSARTRWSHTPQGSATGPLLHHCPVTHWWPLPPGRTSVAGWCLLHYRASNIGWWGIQWKLRFMKMRSREGGGEELGRSKSSSWPARDLDMLGTSATKASRIIPAQSLFPTRTIGTGWVYNLNVFCDASEQAYGSIAYLTTESSDHKSVSFVIARSRVTPKRQLSMPHLELRATLAGAQLSVLLLNELTTSQWLYYYPELADIRVLSIQSFGWRKSLGNPGAHPRSWMEICQLP